MKLYEELAPWYHLVDPHEDHADEAAVFLEALERVARPPVHTLLELGAGAGGNAFHLKGRVRCTLSDLSAEMLSLSRTLNPECEHVQGDMRSLRLDRTFDAVLVHDAVTYLTTEADLLAAARTAFVHLRPGGAAIFAPDSVKEAFRETTNLIEGDDGRKALRGIEWSWDPDPSDDTSRAEYVFVLREGEDVRVVLDRHVEGLFTDATWRRVLAAAGFEVHTFRRPLDDEGSFDDCYVVLRP